MLNEFAMTTLFVVSTMGAVPPAEIGSADSTTVTVNDGLQTLITEVGRAVIPDDYQDNKQWGKTKSVVSGLYVKREGLSLKTHRQRKPVNHGTWTRYRIQMIDPAHLFHVRLQNVRTLENGRLAFDILCDARLQIFGRMSQWQWGVQLISLSAEAVSDVQLTMTCDVATHLDLTSLPPDVVVDPAVRTANLQIREFHLQRLSRLDGPLVRQLSASVREVLEREIERRQDKLVQRINHQLDKRRDRFHLSLNKTLSKTFKSYLPDMLNHRAVNHHPAAAAHPIPISRPTGTAHQAAPSM